MSNNAVHTAFLADILARPDDDTLRLIYADWLDEQGETVRAEFIRLQIDRETNPRWHGAGCTLERPCANCLREAQLFSADWLPLLDGSLREWHFNESSDPPDRPYWYYIRRGFVAEVRCSCADWMKHGPEIVKAHPLETVMLTDKKPRDVDADDKGEWDWFLVDHLPPEDLFELVHDLFNIMVELLPKLPGVKRVDRSGTRTEIPPLFISFGSPDNAYTALSIACIEWARRQS